MTITSAPRLTATEREALRTLDVLCWEDSDAGGDGWTNIRAVAEGMGVSYVWAAQLLQTLVFHEVAERKRIPGDHRRYLYAVSERGAEVLE